MEAATSLLARFMGHRPILVTELLALGAVAYNFGVVLERLHCFGGEMMGYKKAVYKTRRIDFNCNED
jgi:hypothetical protein